MMDNVTLKLRQYEDVKDVIDKALLAGGMKYELSSPKEAVEWRHRFYRYRRILYEVFGVDIPYVQVHISLAKGSSVCDIKVRRPTGKLILHDDPDEELVAFARNLGIKSDS